MNDLQIYGWNDAFEKSWATIATKRLVPARVIADFGTSLKVVTPAEKTATISGHIRHNSLVEDFPKVGDWVGVELFGAHAAVIEVVVPRHSEIARKAAGHRIKKQIMATNIDIAFVLQALDKDFSPERLQRYLYQLSVDHIEPVLVLNKADKTEDLQPYLDAVAPFGVRVIVSSASTGAGVDDIRAAILPGKTAILLGSSGVGKSTLTNTLIGRNQQATQTTRESDDTGRHTTIHRELFILPNGGLLIDTPGIRELQLWGVEEDLAENFDDIAELAAQCKYSNCRHGSEAGCRIQAALQSGELDRTHYQNYLKMRGELKHLASKPPVQDALQKKKALKKMHEQSNRDMRDDYDFPR
ncbi:MAG: ribosome small subunit-dependent GTPase A [Candidatus Saccharibacteria bacterium]